MPLQCPHCPLELASRKALTSHIWEYHEVKCVIGSYVLYRLKKPGTPFQCPIPGCGREYAVRSSITYHVKRGRHFRTPRHFTTKTSTACPLCPKDNNISETERRQLHDTHEPKCAVVLGSGVVIVLERKDGSFICPDNECRWNSFSWSEFRRHLTDENSPCDAMKELERRQNEEEEQHGDDVLDKHHIGGQNKDEDEEGLEGEDETEEANALNEQARLHATGFLSGSASRFGTKSQARSASKGITIPTITTLNITRRSSQPDEKSTLLRSSSLRSKAEPSNRKRSMPPTHFTECLPILCHDCWLEQPSQQALQHHSYQYHRMRYQVLDDQGEILILFRQHKNGSLRCPIPGCEQEYAAVGSIASHLSVGLHGEENKKPDVQRTLNETLACEKKTQGSDCISDHTIPYSNLYDRQCHELYLKLPDGAVITLKRDKADRIICPGERCGRLYNSRRSIRHHLMTKTFGCNAVEQIQTFSGDNLLGMEQRRLTPSQSTLHQVEDMDDEEGCELASSCTKRQRWEVPPRTIVQRSPIQIKEKQDQEQAPLEALEHCLRPSSRPWQRTLSVEHTYHQDGAGDEGDDDDDDSENEYSHDSIHGDNDTSHGIHHPSQRQSQSWTPPLPTLSRRPPSLAAHHAVQPSPSATFSRGQDGKDHRSKDEESDNDYCFPNDSSFLCGSLSPPPAENSDKEDAPRPGGSAPTDDTSKEMSVGRVEEEGTDDLPDTQLSAVITSVRVGKTATAVCRIGQLGRFFLSAEGAWVDCELVPEEVNGEDVDEDPALRAIICYKVLDKLLGRSSKSLATLMKDDFGAFQTAVMELREKIEALDTIVCTFQGMRSNSVLVTEMVPTKGLDSKGQLGSI